MHLPRVLLACCGLWVGVAASARAQAGFRYAGAKSEPGEASTRTLEEAHAPATHEKLRVAVDAVLAKAVADGDVPGALIIVVKDGQVVLLRGYGFANLEAKIPVNPQSTLFYLASLTKPFTATAVMQLVERGKLDLRVDVNRYLTAFQVDPDFQEPVTLEQLLTHTAGFDDKNIGYTARTAAEVRPLGDYLAHELPPRVRPPGQVTAYSNYGYGLAGYLVEVASGKPYADFLQENVFRPLGMSRTTARIPLPPELASDLATGYEYDVQTQRFVPTPLDSRNVPPAGSVSATAPDMARFLMAHLQEGRFGETRILLEDTARRMHARQFTHHPRLPGLTFGFLEQNYRGVRLLQHPGSAPGYSALAILVPEHGLGLFVATNTNALGVNRGVAREVLDFFLPDPGPTTLPTPPARSSTRTGLDGCYQSTRYGHRSIEKFAIWDSQVCVTTTPAGTLRLEDRRGSGSEWVEVEPFVFRSTSRDELLAFREEAGRITYMFGDQIGFPTAFEKLPWWDSIRFQLPYVLTLLAVMASTFTAWPIMAWASRLAHRRRLVAHRSGAQKVALAVAVLTGMLTVVLMAGLDAWIGNSAYRMTLVRGMTREMVALLWLALGFTALALLMAMFTAGAWRHGWWTLWGRVYYSIISMTALLFVLFLAQWNLLGFRY
ncbi:MAG TPA: serine hydrolase domain-containing protein [Candidatus Polarisedimenticolia bacterium]|nr:serine hydrolase domain-containing protein [Candidatus Polarisedimenticolia bacterium]